MKLSLLLTLGKFAALIARVLYNCAGSLCDPLHHLFSMSLHHTTLPSSWKLHKVILIFKAGDQFSVRNYYPISLLSNTSKVLERHLHGPESLTWISSLYILNISLRLPIPPQTQPYHITIHTRTWDSYYLIIQEEEKLQNNFCSCIQLRFWDSYAILFLLLIPPLH